MKTTNFVLIIGNVGQDAKSGRTQSDVLWSSINVATRRRKPDETYDTTWHRVVSYGRAAEVMKSFKRGDGVVVEGEMQNNFYEKNGEQINENQILAKSVLKLTKMEEV